MCGKVTFWDQEHDQDVRQKQRRSTLPQIWDKFYWSHTKNTVCLVTAVTARKKTPMNFHQRGYTCVVPPRGYTCAVPTRYVAAVTARDVFSTTGD